MYGQQMGAQLAFNYFGKILQKELRAPYLTTYVFQALSPLDYTKIMDPIKKFSVMIVKVLSKSSSGLKNVPFLAALYFCKANLLLVLCYLHTLNIKRGRKSMPVLSIQTHKTDVDLNFRLMSDCVKNYETNLILGLLATQGLCK
jgi:hypothetical protein